MHICLVQTNDLEKDKEKIKDLIDKQGQNKILILNLSQKNRILEISLGQQDLIIYNSYDYIKGLCDLDTSILYTDERFDLIPSTIKEENISLVFPIFIKDLEGLLKEEELEEAYDKVLVISQDKIENFQLSNQEDIELINLEASDKKESLIDKIKSFIKGK